MKKYFLFSIFLSLFFLFCSFSVLGQVISTSLPTMPIGVPEQLINVIRNNNDSILNPAIKKQISAEAQKYKTSYKNKVSLLSLNIFDFYLSKFIVNDMQIKDSYYEDMFKTSLEMLNKNINNEVVLSVLLSERPLFYASLKNPVSIFEKACETSIAVSVIPTFLNEADGEMQRAKEDIMRFHYKILSALCISYFDGGNAVKACETLKNAVEYIKQLAPAGADTNNISLVLSDSTFSNFEDVFRDGGNMQKLSWVQDAIQQELPLLRNKLSCTLGKQNK
jgi:hypothetical protein